MKINVDLYFSPIDAIKFNIDKDLKNEVALNIDNNMEDIFEQILNTNNIRENNDPDLLDSLCECMCEHSIDTFMNFVTDIGDIEFIDFEAEDFLRYNVTIDLNFDGLCMEIFHQTV